MPKVSIVVPIYNAEEYLEECLLSIQNQTLKDIEVICVDDGSTDKSFSIMNRFAEEDKRFVVIHKENTGYGNSMNVGMDTAIGQYIGIVESDDWIVPEMMQVLYECAEMNEVDFIKADFYRFVHQYDGKLRKIYNRLTWDAKYYNRVLCPSDETETFRFVMNIWSGIYRTDFIKGNGIRFHETPGASFQDNGFWFQTFALAKRAYFLNKPLYMNRRDNPLSSVNNKEKVFASCKEYDYIHDWVMNGLQGKRKYLYLCAEGRIRNYFFTINRIGDEFKSTFYKRFHDDYVAMCEAGEVAETLLPESWKPRLKRIVDNPNSACEKEQSYRRGYMKLIGEYKDILIYGAGKNARRVYEIIQTIGERNRVAYFVVSDTAKNPAVLYDIPVVTVNMISEELKEKALIIPAVRDAVRDEVLDNIEKHGFKNCSVDDIWINSEEMKRSE